MGAPSQPSPGNVNTGHEGAMKGRYGKATTAIWRHPFHGDADRVFQLYSKGGSWQHCSASSRRAMGTWRREEPHQHDKSRVHMEVSLRHIRLIYIVFPQNQKPFGPFEVVLPRSHITVWFVWEFRYCCDISIGWV